MPPAAPSFLHLAEVVETHDPESLHRVRVRLLNRPETPAQETWARMAMPYASHQAGWVFRPEVGDEVVVAFDRAEASAPIILGSLYNGRHEPPGPHGEKEAQAHKGVHTASGHEISIHDNPEGGITLQTGGGHRVTLNDGDNAIHLAIAGGSSIEVGAAGITIQSPGTVTIDAAIIKLKAGTIEANTGMFKVSGVLQSATVITDTVVANTYTPGAGNIG